MWLIGADPELHGGRRGQWGGLDWGVCLGWRVMPARGGGGSARTTSWLGVAPCSSQCRWRGISEETCDVNGVTEWEPSSRCGLWGQCDLEEKQQPAGDAVSEAKPGKRQPLQSQGVPGPCRLLSFSPLTASPPKAPRPPEMQFGSRRRWSHWRE